nr:hypothetical protein [Gammaproteobacteria bacterium]
MSSFPFLPSVADEPQAHDNSSRTIRPAIRPEGALCIGTKLSYWLLGITSAVHHAVAATPSEAAVLQALGLDTSERIEYRGANREPITFEEFAKQVAGGMRAHADSR